MLHRELKQSPLDPPQVPPDDAPDPPKAVWPVVLQWGESDDVNRGDLTAAATDEELEALVQAVDPLYPMINAYLDETGDAEHAVPFGDLALAAMEARYELDRRTS